MSDSDVLDEANVDASIEDCFAPACEDAIDHLIRDYDRIRSAIGTVGDFMVGQDMMTALGFFFEANRQRFDRYIPSPEHIFDQDSAIKALNAHFWNRALEQTDLLDVMPEKRRDEWRRQIAAFDCPSFDEATVRDNLDRLLVQRLDFLAEKVDGIFTNLSGDHVTNRPEGFSARMIIAGVFSEFGTTTLRAGYIHDLRGVIAKLMGRDEPRHGATRSLLDFARRDTGTWFPVDGFAFRIRVYKKGTAHVEIHPDVAWRLNQILAHLHPSVIPPAHRRRPRRNARHVTLFSRPLSFAVIHALTEGRYMRRSINDEPPNSFHFGYDRNADASVRAAAGEVLAALGGIPKSQGRVYQFDYDAEDAIGAVAASGMLPDRQAYQFYPTPEDLAAEISAQAAIEPGHRCLEPSAGLGSLAANMPADTICVEVSSLHAQILSAAGRHVVTSDFLEFRDGYFDRICMNPPFDAGRARAHLEHAASMLAAGGRLVAVLPAGLINKDLLPGFDVTLSPVKRNRFPHTRVDVVILSADRPV